MCMGKYVHQRQYQRVDVHDYTQHVCVYSLTCLSTKYGVITSSGAQTMYHVIWVGGYFSHQIQSRNHTMAHTTNFWAESGTKTPTYQPICSLCTRGSYVRVHTSADKQLKLYTCKAISSFFLLHLCLCDVRECCHLLYLWLYSHKQGDLTGGS